LQLKKNFTHLNITYNVQKMNNRFKKKILTIDQLKKFRNTENKIILCHGVFDVLHYGHLNHFEFAKEKASKLIVSVTHDRFVNKGPNRPINKINDRLRLLASLEIIDYVVCSPYASAVEMIDFLKPNYYLKGEEYQNIKNDTAGNLNKEKKICKKNKVKILFSTGANFSSSKIINKLDYENLKQKKFLKRLRDKINSKEIQKTFNLIKKKKILVIGETIIDRYIFSEVIGKSGKEPMLVLNEKFRHDYVGGAASISKQILNYSNDISFLTCLGEKKEHLKLVDNYLKGVRVNYIFKKTSPTILKMRYVDEASNTKMLGVYNINDKHLGKNDEDKVLKLLKKNISKFDLVIISDYGHGFLTQKISSFISKNAKKISVNCQINANNSGLHTIQKYKNPNIVLINESEMRNEMRDKDSPSILLIKRLSKHLKAKNVIVTQGNEGALFYNSSLKKFIKVPAFGSVIKDKVGSGDLFLSIFSIIYLVSKNIELALYGASLCAAETLKGFGNYNMLTKEQLKKTILYNLK